MLKKNIRFFILFITALVLSLILTSTILAKNKATEYQIVSAENFHNLAVKSDGTLWAWGCNTNGQVGDGTTSIRYSPVQVGTDTN